MLLEADGFDDLATRAEYLRRVEEADAALVARACPARSGRRQLAAVDAAEQRAEAFQTGSRPPVTRSCVQASARSESGGAGGEPRSRQAAVDSLQSQVAGWTSEVERLERISARQAQREVGDWFGDWAIPESIVMCESRQQLDAVNPSSGAGGAYQIMPSTWGLYGGEGDPEDASPSAQSDIASQIWADSGAAAWACAGFQVPRAARALRSGRSRRRPARRR